jgi:hypothetical protein
MLAFHLHFKICIVDSAWLAMFRKHLVYILFNHIFLCFSWISHNVDANEAQYGYRLQHGKKFNIGVVVGASLAGVFVVVIILVGLCALKIKKKHLGSLDVLRGDTQPSTGVHLSKTSMLNHGMSF